MNICDNCAREHPRTAEIMVRCAGTTTHATCVWCWNSNSSGIVYEVRPDCAIAASGKPGYGPYRPRILDAHLDADRVSNSVDENPFSK